MKLSSANKISLAILFLLVTYWPISCMQFTMKYDMMDWFYPMRFLVGECLQNNVLPVWNPYTNLGYPLHVDPQSGALYPIVWVLGWLFGYNVYTINLEYLIHILFAFYGMKKLAEELGMKENVAIIIGLSYACCGFFVGNAQHLGWIISAAWIPFMIYYYLRLIRFNHWRYALWLSLFSFLLLTGGYPAFIITTFYLLGLAFLVQVVRQFRKKEYKNLKRFVVNNVVFGIAFLLQSLVFLRFFLESLSYMVRTEALTLSSIQFLPFSPQSFLSFVLPFVTGGENAFFGTDFSMSNGYFGLITFLFMLLYLWRKPDQKSLILWSLAIFFLLVAVGDAFFLREWLYHYVPMMNMFKYPSLFRIFALIPLMLLAGLSIQKNWGNNESVPQIKKLRILILGLIVLIGGVFIYAFQKTNLVLPESFSAAGVIAFFNKSTNSQMALIQAPVQILLLSLLLLKTYIKKGMVFMKFALILLLVDLSLSVQFNAFLTITAEANAPQLQERIDALPSGFPIPTKKISAVAHNGNKQFYPIWYNHNILRKEIAYNGYNNFKFRAYRSFKETPGHMEILKNPLLFDSEHIGQDSLTIANRGSVKITAYSPTEIRASVAFKEASELTLLQYFYPGWTVTMDGKSITPFQKEEIFLAVNVPEGEHDLVYRFYPSHFTFYLLISFTAFIVLLVYLSYTSKQKI